MNTITERPFTLCLETWPQADLRLHAQQPLALARQSIALRLARIAADAGASLLLLAENADSLARFHAAADFPLDAPETATPQEWQRRVGTENRVLFVRWGSGGLLTTQNLLGLAASASKGQTWGNRTPNADILAGLAPLDLPWRIRPQAVFPPTAATLFRLLTGSDLSLFSTCADNTLSGDVALLPTPAIKHNIATVTHLMTQRPAELLVIGDPGAQGWKYLERETACRVRLLAEDRGGLVASLLQSAGVDRFVRYIGELGDAALINTRTLFAASNYPSPDDFFWSDLGRPGRIAHPVLRALTEAVLASNQAVVLGGASLTSGGIYLLVEKAWVNRTLPRQVSILETPETRTKE